MAEVVQFSAQFMFCSTPRLCKHPLPLATVSTHSRSLFPTLNPPTSECRGQRGVLPAGQHPAGTLPQQRRPGSRLPPGGPGCSSAGHLPVLHRHAQACGFGATQGDSILPGTPRTSQPTMPARGSGGAVMLLSERSRQRAPQSSSFQAPVRPALTIVGPWQQRRTSGRPCSAPAWPA